MDAELIWRSKSDKEVVEAARQLADYEDDGQRIIRAELERRGLTSESPSFDRPVSMGPDRIGGWLILPGISLALGSVLGVVNVARALSLAGDALAAGLGASFLWAVVVDAGIVAFTIFATVRFLARKRSAPRIIIALLATEIVAEGLLLLVTQREGQAPFGGAAGMAFLRSIVFGSIWIAYFSVSKRVKATFVN
jgi:hypothetical protein